jgi:hypothetical protein
MSKGIKAIFAAKKAQKERKKQTQKEKKMDSFNYEEESKEHNLPSYNN